jgi:lipid-A-disaccharide synthase
MPKILISAGEASGDYHGAALARALRELAPGVELRGLGGARMAQAGVDLIADIKDMNVMGLVELLPQLRKILAIKKRTEQTALAWKPDAVVCIDFPDFNLRLAAKLHKQGLRTVYYIPPKLWAWRSWRAKKLKRVIDQVLVIFPFEVAFYETYGIAAEFVGNPLIDDCRMAARPHPVGAPVVGLVPGSRKGEIATLLPPMLEAAKLLAERMPGVHFRLPAASSVSDLQLEPARAAGIEILRRPLPEVLATCDYAWVASGTASLEAALVEVPMVVVYRLNALSFAIARALVNIKHFSLPNILAGREVVPELLQADVNGPRLAAEAERVLADAAARDALHAGLRSVKEQLGAPGAATRAAAAILRRIEEAHA